MVDGTLVPLFARSGFYGNTWYGLAVDYLNAKFVAN